MPEKHLYEYAVIRLLPRVERGECLNLGVVLYCKSQRFLDVRFSLNEARIKAVFGEIDLLEVEKHLESFKKICEGDKDAGLLASQDMASRFRWLTAKRSTIIQASEIHPGYCISPEEKLEQLFKEMVL
ncbi:MAG: hypothetical protein ACI9IP_002423 [Arcticibacterium sp.]|jgi:hypothetical protein